MNLGALVKLAWVVFKKEGIICLTKRISVFVFKKLKLQLFQTGIVLKSYFLKTIWFFKKLISVFKRDGLLVFIRKTITSIMLQKKIHDTDDNILKELLNFFKGHNFVFFVPTVTVGGADKLMVEYVNALKGSEHDPCLITTLEPGCKINQISVPWLDMKTTFPEWEGLDIEKKTEIFLKAIIISGIRIVHVVNSEIALQLIKYKKDMIQKHGIKTLVSLFCPDFNWINNEYGGFPVMYPEVLLNADVILSDNNYWFTYFKKLAGQDFNYKKIFSPVKEPLKIKNQFSNNKKILWASRICNQKLLGVLLDICKKRPDLNFVIYGSISDNKQACEYFQEILKLKNIEYKGMFSDYTELKIEEFDLFLYTSLFDGIPNVILEIIALNIPVVTSFVGGISEVISEDYGLVVKDIENADVYCQKIDEFYTNAHYYFDKTSQIKKHIYLNYNLNKFKEEYLGCIKSLDGVFVKRLNWQKNLESEVYFWKHKWFKNDKGVWTKEYLERVDPSLPVQERIVKLLPKKEKINILDVGAGPLTSIGKILKGRKVDILPVDPLASMYAEILNELNIKPIIKTQYGEVEKLSEIFAENQFDLVNMENALDHSHDPLEGIKQMLRVVKDGCYVTMLHSICEAEAAGYQGLHQFNFDTDKNGDFIIWNMSSCINVNNEVNGLGECEIEVDRLNRKLLVNIKKTHGTN